MNNELPFRFSTKYADDECDFLYYGLRYYNPSAGRWLSRDPIEEQGGINLYQFVLNRPIDFVDPFGLEVALQDHKVTGRFYHSLIRITPDDQEYWRRHPKFVNRDERGNVYVTIGAGPWRGWLLSELNRDSDVLPHPNSVALALPSRYQNEFELICALLQLDRNYKDNLAYDPLPSPLPALGYNSNSYISGIMDAAGLAKPSREVPGSREFPGWEKPVPLSEFRAK